MLTVVACKGTDERDLARLFLGLVGEAQVLMDCALTKPQELQQQFLGSGRDVKEATQRAGPTTEPGEGFCKGTRSAWQQPACALASSATCAARCRDGSAFAAWTWHTQCPCVSACSHASEHHQQKCWPAMPGRRHWSACDRPRHGAPDLALASDISRPQRAACARHVHS